LTYGAVKTKEGTVAYVGGCPLLSADSGVVRLRPDLDGANREGMGRDLREFGPAEPLCASLYFPEDSEDGAALLARLPIHTAPAPAREKELALRSGDLMATLHMTGHGVDLTGITDQRTGESWLRGENNALFSVLLRQVGGEKQYMLSSLDGWEDVSALSGHGRLTLVFDRPRDPALAGVSIVLTAACDPDRNRISWDMDLQNNSETVAYVDTAKTSQISGLRNWGQIPITFGYGKSQ
jgi:hypothetical protein